MWFNFGSLFSHLLSHTPMMVKSHEEKGEIKKIIMVISSFLFMRTNEIIFMIEILIQWNNFGLKKEKN